MAPGIKDHWCANCQMPRGPIREMTDDDLLEFVPGDVAKRIAGYLPKEAMRMVTSAASSAAYVWPQWPAVSAEITRRVAETREVE